MPKAVRARIDFSQGHGWMPSIIDIPSNLTVFHNGVEVAVVGDQYNMAMHDHPSILIPPHPIFAVIGSPNVFINGRPILRDGDPLNCGDVADVNNAIPSNLYINGGGRGGPARGAGETTGYVTNIPVLSYENTYILTYVVKRDDNTGQWVFVNGCPFSAKILDAYSPLGEEDTDAEFKNYPGPPVTSKSGADLPSYAADYARKPVAIYDFKLSMAPKGITINPISGELSGALEEAYTANAQIYAYIKASNFVGESNPTVVKFILTPVFSCS